MGQRLFSPKQKRFVWATRIGVGLVGALLILYAVIPDAKRPELRSELEPKTARRLMSSLTLKTPPPLQPERLELAQWGRKLFFDKQLSADGSQSCADCHSFNGSTHSRDSGRLKAPLLVNLGDATWFFHDGRQATLSAAVLESLESSTAMHSNRLHVANFLRTRHREQYSKLFGEWPASLDQKLPAHGYPDPSTTLALPLDLASEALATITDFDLLEDILKVARKKHIAPVTEMTSRIFKLPNAEEEWVKSYEKLSKEQKVDATKVFANVGTAIAVYIATIRSSPSAFDRYASALQESAAEESIQQPRFAAAEKRGFGLFATHCMNCHFGPSFTGGEFHNIGLPPNDRLELGRAAGIVRVSNSQFGCNRKTLGSSYNRSEGCRQVPYLSKINADTIGSHKTASLRHLDVSSAYMRDGRFRSLDEVIDFYAFLSDRAAIGRRTPLLKAGFFTPEDTNDLKAFLLSLTSPITELNGQLMTTEITQIQPND